MIEGMLNYNIKGTGLEISDELRSYAEKKLQQAEKFLHGDSTAHADIELEHEAMRNGDRNRAEFTVEASGEVYRAESWGETMHAALDLAIAELLTELGRTKKKRIDIVRRSAARAKDFLRGLRG
jgi:putative sigma-54 modulation protein